MNLIRFMTTLGRVECGPRWRFGRINEQLLDPKHYIASLELMNIFREIFIVPPFMTALNNASYSDLAIRSSPFALRFIS